MIAKIGRSSNLFVTLSYNNLKIEKENAEILLMNKMIETVDSKYSVAHLARSFEPYLLANRNTEKHTLHISLNPDPKDQVSDEEYREVARQYMAEMGYGGQPFIVFKHTDIDRSHIHIVSVCVDEDGKKISDKFERIRSMDICRELEKKYGMTTASDKVRKNNEKIFWPVNYRAGDIKSQIASVVRHLPTYYQYQTLGEYNALLSLFNITTDKIDGELQGKMRQGLLYIPLNEKGERAGHPLKASLFGKNAGLPALELQFAKNKASLKGHSSKTKLINAVTTTLRSTISEREFKKNLIEHNIDTLVRRNETGRIYGITFIDHNSRTVWNGSRLGKEFSANTFNEHWNHYNPDISETVEEVPKPSHKDDSDLTFDEPPRLFSFLNNGDKHEDDIVAALGGLLPEALGEDQEEQDFENRMRKKRKRGRNQK